MTSTASARGVLHFDDLRGTILLKIDPAPIDHRGPAVVGMGAADLADRVLEAWPLKSCVKRGLPIRRVVAVTRASGPDGDIVLGDWETTPVHRWDVESGRIGVFDPAAPNPSTVGARFDWGSARSGRTISYSGDIRAALAV